MHANLPPGAARFAVLGLEWGKLKPSIARKSNATTDGKII